MMAVYAAMLYAVDVTVGRGNARGSDMRGCCLPVQENGIHLRGWFLRRKGKDLFVEGIHR